MTDAARSFVKPLAEIEAARKALSRACQDLARIELSCRMIGVSHGCLMAEAGQLVHRVELFERAIKETQAASK